MKEIDIGFWLQTLWSLLLLFCLILGVLYVLGRQRRLFCFLIFSASSFIEVGCGCWNECMHNSSQKLSVRWFCQDVSQTTFFFFFCHVLLLSFWPFWSRRRRADFWRNGWIRFILSMNDVVPRLQCMAETCWGFVPFLEEGRGLCAGLWIATLGRVLKE